MGNTNGTINLKNLTITGNLTINTPNAHVTGAISTSVGGTTNVVAVSNTSFVSSATHTGGIVVTDSDGATIDLSGAASSAAVTLDTTGPVKLAGTYTGAVTLAKKATVEVAADASLTGGLVVSPEAAGATINNGGEINKVTANGDVIVTGTAATEITGTGTITGNALPKGEATAELKVDGLTTDTLKFLVFGLPETGAQQASTLAEVKSHIDTKYGVTFNDGAITVETDGTLKVTGPLLSTEDWNKVKTNGNKAIAYKITVLKGDKTSKVAKIAMYQDGTVEIEKLS